MGLRPEAVRQDTDRDIEPSRHKFFFAESGYAGRIQTSGDEEEEDEDEDERTEMIYAVSEIGDMVDFIKAFPSVSVDDYLWKLSVPMVQLMRFDNTHLEHLSEKEAKRRKAERDAVQIGGEYGFDGLNDLGKPIGF